MTLLPRPLLLLVLLAAAALNGRKARASGAEARRRSHDPAGESRVSLCGRELIRAVVFMCGGSRWKRIAEPRGEAEQQLQGGAGLPNIESSPPLVKSSGCYPSATKFVQSNVDKETEDVKLQSVLDPELEPLQHIGQPTVHQPLKVLFNVYGDYDAYVPVSDKSSEYIRQIDKVLPSRSGPGLAKLMRSNNFPWVSNFRRKRDFSLGVAEQCCRWGCTNTEISTLC